MASPPADRPSSSVANLLGDLVRSRVLDRDRARSLVAGLPGHNGDPASLLDRLVERGVLTRFQADKLLSGQWQNLVLGPFVLLAPLGRGGMGVVYLARDPAGGPPLALKVLPPARARERPRTLARFLREKEIGQRLPVHPNLARTLAAGEAGGTHYLALEYVPGQTVRQFVNESGPLAVGLAARIFADVAAGLHAAHEAGFVHRDLKPANIIVTPGGRAKLLDFGFALIRGEATPTDPALLGGPGYTLGTMDYLPPEQAVDPVGVGPAADLYALGCSLYYALAGCPPFPGGSVKDKLRWHRTDPPPPLEHFNSAVPAGLLGLIARLMAKRVDERPASAADVAVALREWADPVLADGIAPAGNTSPAEAYQQIDDVWDETPAGSEGTEEHTILLEPDSRGPAVPRPPLPRWLAALVLAGFGGIVALAAVLGWLVGRFLS